MPIRLPQVNIGKWKSSVKAKMALALALSGGFFRKGVALEGDSH